MAYGLKLAGANLAYKGGLLNGNRYIGLLSAENTEFTQSGYARELMALPDWAPDGRAYENAAQELFGPPQVIWPAIVGWDLRDQLTGGNRLFNVDVTDTGAPGIGASVGADAEQIGFQFTGGNLTVEGSVKCFTEGLLSGNRYLILCSGATPNSGDGATDGNGNFINTDGTTGYGSGKTPVSVAITPGQWTLDTVSSTRRRARNNIIKSYGIQAADLPDPMTVALLRRKRERERRSVVVDRDLGRSGAGRCTPVGRERSGDRVELHRVGRRVATSRTLRIG